MPMFLDSFPKNAPGLHNGSMKGGAIASVVLKPVQPITAGGRTAQVHGRKTWDGASTTI